VTSGPDLSLFPPSAVVAGADLVIGGCSVRELADQFGTPAYVLDEQALRARAREYVDALATRRTSGFPDHRSATWWWCRSQALTASP
jgi:hypothetical protein